MNILKINAMHEVRRSDNLKYRFGSMLLWIAFVISASLESEYKVQLKVIFYVLFVLYIYWIGRPTERYEVEHVRLDKSDNYIDQFNRGVFASRHNLKDVDAILIDKKTFLGSKLKIIESNGLEYVFKIPRSGIVVSNKLNELCF